MSGLCMGFTGLCIVRCLRKAEADPVLSAREGERDFAFLGGCAFGDASAKAPRNAIPAGGPPSIRGGARD